MYLYEVSTMEGEVAKFIGKSAAQAGRLAERKWGMLVKLARICIVRPGVAGEQYGEVKEDVT